MGPKKTSVSFSQKKDDISSEGVLWRKSRIPELTKLRNADKGVQGIRRKKKKAELSCREEEVRSGWWKARDRDEKRKENGRQKIGVERMER